MNLEGMFVKKLAPILVLGYRRPSHLKKALKSLALNPEAEHSILFVAIDGPKTDAEIAMVQECREIAASVSGFKEVITSFQDTNIGLANSVILNVSRVFSEYGTIIVVEDDLVVSDQFLAFMNLGLESYAENLKVASIHGYQYPLKLSSNESVFLRGADCWGWATWKDRWNTVNFSADSLMEEILKSGLKRDFDLYGAVPNFRMLQDQSLSKIDSWAIRWHASMYLQGRLTLFPPTSLVLNCGLDGSGTHEGNSQQFQNNLIPEIKWGYPTEIKESRRFRNKLILFYFRTRISRVLTRIQSWPIKLLKFAIGQNT